MPVQPADPAGLMPAEAVAAPPPTLREIAREWTRIGCIGFGGPAAHIALLRQLVVERRGWIPAHELEDAIAATNLLPGPGSTQLAIFCAWRLGGIRGALVGGLGFIVPGLIVILALSALFLAASPPTWVRGAGAGAGAAVAAVALQAALGLLAPGWRRHAGARRVRWAIWVVLGGTAAATLGAWLVLVLLGCGAAELIWQRSQRPAREPAGDLASDAPAGDAATVAPSGDAGTAGGRGSRSAGVHGWPLLIAAAVATGGLGALAWTAFKVGALSYGGGFVIIPLMQADAVGAHHWMTSGQFVNAVALGQVTPGPVVHTVAVVGYAAAGIGGGLLAAAVAFAPSFSFILLGGERFDRLRGNAAARAFLDGAGPAAIGAIAGSTIPLARALSETWQFAVLAAAVVAVLVARRGVVTTLVGAGVVGAVLGLAGAPLPG